MLCTVIREKGCCDIDQEQYEICWFRKGQYKSTDFADGECREPIVRNLAFHEIYQKARAAAQAGNP
jgi:hypothetical protein